MRQHSIIAVMLAALFATSVIAQEAPVTPPAADGAPPATAAAAAAGKIKITLLKNMELEGAPVDLEEIKMNSIFGEASIPLHTFAGIRFAQKPQEQSTIVLLNGDALTGEIALSEVKCIAEWGEAKVNVPHIVSIVFRPNLSWSSVATPGGQRWQLKKVSNPTTYVQPSR